MSAEHHAEVLGIAQSLSEALGFSLLHIEHRLTQCRLFVECFDEELERLRGELGAAGFDVKE